MDVVRALGDQWRHVDGPLYHRLAASFRDAIRRGDLGPPSRIPSERDLARLLRVSRTTVASAYSLLRSEGLVDSRRGSGTRLSARAGLRVPAVAAPSLRFLGEGAEDIIDCAAASIAEIDEVSDELLTVAADDVRHVVARYVYEPLGIRVLRAAIAARYTRQGLPTGADDILITTGAQQSVALLFALFARDGGPLLLENPTYVGALDAARAMGASVVAVATEDGGASLSDLADKLKKFPVRAIYVMSTCQNPTGAVMDDAWRQEVGRLAAAHATPVIDDMTLADLKFGSQAHPFLASSGTTVATVGSLSKLYWPGLRVGWVRAPAPLLARLAKLKVVADLGSSHFSQLLAARLLDHADAFAVSRREQLRTRLERFSQLLHEHLPEWRFAAPRGGPFLWVSMPGGDADAFAAVALRNGVQVLSGTKMSPDDSIRDRLRVSYVAPPEDLPTAVLRLRTAWNAFRGEAGQVPPLDVVV
jgi:DNA-binding transcriptional MocR family regulator